MSSDCLFCKIVAGEIPAEKVYEDESILAFRDINPQAPTHILVIPKEHRERVSDYEMNDAELLGKVTAAANLIAKQEGIDDYRLCINCGADAGQAVFHLHMHLLAGRSFSWPPG